MTKKRKRFKDRRSVGSSAIAPYKAGETYRERHARRLATGIEYREEVEVWCVSRCVSFKVTNSGHHWKFTRARDGRIAEWWPSSAKLVVAKNYRNGFHVHDYKQAIKLLSKIFPPIG